MWDVTRVVDLQASLRRSEAMSAMGALIAGVAHEVRNPLFGMSATIDLIEQTAAADYAEYAAVLRRELNRVVRLMTDLLDYGRPQTSELTTASIMPIINDAIAACTPEVQRTSVRVACTSCDALPPVHVDAPQMRRVFVNLIENATQHSPAGGVVTVTLREEIRSDRLWLRCDVSDEGPGFRVEDLHRIFEPFFSRRKGGTGLGLSIVQRIVDEHGGIVETKNAPSGGAVVSVLLPAKETA